MKKNSQLLLVSAIVSLIPTVVLAQTKNLDTLVLNIQGFINNRLIPFVFLLALVYYLWNVLQYVQSGKDLSGLKDKVLWGVVGLACMVSVWGLVNLVTNTFQLDSSTKIVAPHF